MITQHIRLIEVVKRNHTQLFNFENKFIVNLRNVSMNIYTTYGL